MSFWCYNEEGEEEAFDLKYLTLDVINIPIKACMEPDKFSFILTYVPISVAGGWAKVDIDNPPLLSSAKPRNQISQGNRVIRRLFLEAKSLDLIDKDLNCIYILDYGRWMGLIDNKWIDNYWSLATPDLMEMSTEERLKGYILRMI